MEVMRTERLVLRWLSEMDAGWIRDLVTDPDWLRYIGDRGVETVEDARAYLLRGPMEPYTRLGFGLYRVELRDSGLPIGICGLIKRDALDDVDLGFAYLPQFRGLGYAHEAAAATLEHARDAFGFSRIAAIVSPDNAASVGLLRKLGFEQERAMRFSDEADEVLLFGRRLDPGPLTG